MSTKVYILLLSALALLGMHMQANAETMTSEEYHITGQLVVGASGSQTLSSSHFTLTPRVGSAYTYDESTQEEEVSKSGSRSRTVTTTPPTAPEFIRAVITREHVQEKGVWVEPVPREYDTYKGTEETPFLNTVNIEPRSNGPRVPGLDASLIQGVRGTYITMSAFLTDTFKERSARVIFFCIVLVVLWLVRTYTSWGNTYRPF